jgi:hypothetical protein
MCLNMHRSSFFFSNYNSTCRPAVCACARVSARVRMCVWWRALYAQFSYKGIWGFPSAARACCLPSSAARPPLLAVGYCLLAVGYWLLAIGYWLGLTVMASSLFLQLCGGGSIFFWGGGAFTTGQAAQRAPPKNHGPASRRPRPSAESGMPCRCYPYAAVPPQARLDVLTSKYNISLVIE